MTATYLLSVFASILIGQTTPPATDTVPPTTATPLPDASEPAGYVAEVTGDDVYVRSGPSANYYPVTKLNAGQRVRVVGQEGDWLAIDPPEGCFSLISKVYVDVDADEHGVVNGDNVRVRVGSLLTSDMYAVQLKLSRGAEVSIVGDGGNEYYRIAPPPGAKLWASNTYVQRVPDNLLALEAAGGTTPAGLEPTDDGEALGPQPEGDAELTASTAPLTGAQIQEARLEIEGLDAQLKAELTKPLLSRDLARFRAAFEALVQQHGDAFTQAYASARIEQIDSLQEMIDAVRGVRDLREHVKAARTDALARRAGIRPQPTPVASGFDAEGELRPSLAYDSPAVPKRYRLVDPDKSPVRTVGYVEIPPDSAIDAEGLLGRRVGVRAREIRLETGNVQPISIFVAADLVPLDGAGE